MMDLGVFPKGLLAGLAPTVERLCILVRSRKAGRRVWPGLGPQQRRFLWRIAGFSINFIIQLLIREEILATADRRSF